MKDRSKSFFKQIIAWCTALALILSFSPGYVLATQEQAVSLEKAVQIAKAAFDIPKEFTQFSSGYNQYEERQAWELRWNTEKEPRGSFYIQLDCQSGEILYMNFWQSSLESRNKLPAISRDEAVKIATELVKSLQPRRLSELKLEENNEEILQLTSWAPRSYRIKWVRQVQGVPFRQDGATVSVDIQTGQITSYNFNWTEGDFPTTSEAISLEKARQAWEKAEMLQLQYFRPAMIKADEERKVKLVYRLTHPSQGILDALTGKPLELGQGMMREESIGNMMKQAMDRDEEAVFTPEELKEIESAGKVVSQAKAEAVVKKWVSLPEDFAIQAVRLNQDEQRGVGARTWSLSWGYAEDAEDKGEGRWLDAQVDAVSGELLSFSWHQPMMKESSTQVERLSRDETQKKAEDFLCQIQPELFKQVKLNDLRTSEPPRPLIFEEQPLRQYFEYQRVVNDIVFPANGMSVSVDTATGEIDSYSLKWQELQFPSAEGILNSTQINEQFLKRQPLTLLYLQDVVPLQSGAKKEIRLVYCPIPTPGQQGEAMSDAKTGTALDWQGKPLSEQPRPYTFTDIAGHWAEKEIALLGQAGILGEYAPTFYPETPITAVQYLRALLMIERGVEGVYTLSDEEVMKQARESGWLKEELQATSVLDRLQLARLGIRFLEFEKVAKIEGIYTVPYQDLQNIASADRGYVALAWGLGILKGEQGSFQSEQLASRAQAAVTLIRMLKTDLK